MTKSRLTLLFIFLFSSLLQAQIGSAAWATTVPKDSQEPAWWDQGVVFVGNWEPLVFRLRKGGDLPVDAVERYQREHSEETVLKLKEAGVNMILTHFYKTGLDSDKEDIEMAKRLGELCHKHGMKLGAYIGGTIFAETLLRDVPGAKAWIRYDEHGDPVRYGDQTYRYRPDFNHPGYVEHMKKVIHVAVEDVKADLIHLDNHALIAPPWTGATPEINRRFREFLTKKYSPEQLKDRFGFSDISAVTVPSWQGIKEPAGISPIGDPLIQEWIDFRCQDFAEYYGKLADYTHHLNPNVLVELNPHGIYGSNRAFLNGIDHARLLPHGSVFWSEERNEAQVTSDGILVSKIRSLKLARTLDQTLFIYTGPQRADAERHSYRLLMAESMAFNRNCLGDVGSPMSAYDLPEDARRYIRFYLDNNRHFASTRVVADVAILRSFPSMANNSLDPHIATTLVEQLLIQYKIPFEYVFDQNLGDLSKYRAVILAGQEALSDRAVEQLREYVQRGGGLVAIGRTALYNDWRRVRPDYGLADVLGIHVSRDFKPSDVLNYTYETAGASPSDKRGSFGQGRFVYLPKVIPAVPVDDPESVAANGFGQHYWALPENSDQIVEAIRYAAGAAFSVEFTGAPLTTVMELTDKKDGSERILHWVNYELGTQAKGARVNLAIPQGKKVTGVELLSPDRGGATLKFSMDGQRIRFVMPSLEVYNVAVVTLSD